MPTRITLHPRHTGETWPYPERPPDWEPTISEEPGFFEQLPDRARRGVNTLSDVLFGSTPEERVQNLVASVASPFGTAATSARRMLRPLLSGDLTSLLPNRARPEWLRPGFKWGTVGHPVDNQRLPPSRGGAPFTPEERQIVRDRISDPYLQETPIRHYNDPEWDDAHQRMDEVMKTWASNTSPWVRNELDDIVTNTEFGRHYLDRLHGLLREIYPSGQMPLYRGLGEEELETVLAYPDWLRHVWPTLSRHEYRPESAMLQSFTLSPNMSRRFAGGGFTHGPGGKRQVLHGNVPIENVRAHMRSPTMQEEEFIVDVLPRRPDLLPDWKVAEGAKSLGIPYSNPGRVKQPLYWQNLMKDW